MCLMYVKAAYMQIMEIIDFCLLISNTGEC